MDWDQYYKDTQRFRNAYSDFRRTESSTLSSQYDLWDHSARRSSAALSIANVKQPQYRAVSRIGIVDTPETARLHPHRLSKLSPFVSNYTVDPTSGTTSLFMNQWHNGLGLPTRADDEAIEGFRMIKKSQFIDNQTAILESKAPELRYIKGNKILQMCKDLFSSTDLNHQVTYCLIRANPSSLNFQGILHSCFHNLYELFTKSLIKLRIVNSLDV
jgi:hypothetical protein